ncbi:MAG: LuxR C-terminal-related transcriptional regulator [Coriobacteriaceae bacterium]|nr:LuxR C-terminal-related transcriptional regulator [Coriobacteriaceae bacterium]
MDIRKRIPGKTVVSSLLGSPYVLGLALMRTWTLILFFSTILADLPGILPETLLDIYLVSFAVFVAVCIAAGIAMKKAEAFLSSRFGTVAGSVMAGAGTLAFVLMPVMPAFQPQISLAIAFATGAGSSLVLLRFSWYFSSVRFGVAARESAMAYFLGSLLLLPFFFLPVYLTLGFASLLPLVATFAYRDSALKESKRAELPQDDQSRRELLKFCISAAVFGITVGFSVSLAQNASDQTIRWSFLHALIQALVLMVIAFFIIRRMRVGPLWLYRIELVFTSLGFLVLLFAKSDGFLPGLLVPIDYTLFELLIWMTFSHLSHRSLMPTLRLFGLWRGVLLGCGTFLGGFALAACNRYFPEISEYSELVYLISIALLIISYVVVFNEHDVSRLFPHTADPGGKVGGMPAEGADNTSQEGAQDDAGSLSIPPDKPSPVREANSAMVLHQRCKEVAGDFGLSAREAEVMELMVSGLSTFNIQEELFISAGTVNSHRMHIYQKLGIHSLQELSTVIMLGNRLS